MRSWLLQLLLSSIWTCWSEALIDCTEAVLTKGFTGKCNNKWKNLKSVLRPTQKQVGYAWIKSKLQKDFQSQSDAEKAVDIVPAVIGPGPSIYIVDDHHTLCALDYSGFEDISITVDVSCNKADDSDNDFWRTLDAQNLAYLASHPNDGPNELPQSISADKLSTFFAFTHAEKTFSDDYWRSLAGFSRKVTDPVGEEIPKCEVSKGESILCERAMYRGCGENGYDSSGPGVAFFEFRWAYFMNDATYFSTDLWPDEADRLAFVEKYEDLQRPARLESRNGTVVYETSKDSVMDNIDVSLWKDAARYIITLSRSVSGSSYLLPADIYGFKQSNIAGISGSRQLRSKSTTKELTLPGYFSGYVKLPDDPSCSLPMCA